MATRDRPNGWSSALRGGALLAGFLAWAVGCGTAGPPTGRVQGRVTYEGAPVAEGVVSLYSAELGLGASADIGADGAYTISAPLKTGKYTVAVMPPPDPPPQDAIPVASKKEYPNIPQRYRDPKQSGLSVEITAGENRLDVKMTK